MDALRIETERLVLRAWRSEDLEPYAAICADPEVMRWIGDGSVRSREASARQICDFQQRWDDDGFGPFAVELRHSSALIGFVGMLIPDFLPEIMPAVEIGWRLDRRYWGQGYATEAARAALAFAFEEAGFSRLVSICQVGNEASERVMLKLGMTLDRETREPALDLPIRVYAIERAPKAVR